MLLGAAMSVSLQSVIGLLWIIVIINCGFVTLVEGKHKPSLDNSALGEEEKEPIKEDFSSHDALERLSNLFGISKIPENFHHRTPPDYMLELYSTVAYDDGITKQSVPYDADVVRAIPDKALHQQILYHFNLSYIQPSDEILQAEFHLYKIAPHHRSGSKQAGENSKQGGDNQSPANSKETGDNQPPANSTQARDNQQPPSSRRHAHILQLKLYQILDPGRPDDRGAQKLLHQRRVSTYQRGWEIFKVKDTVREWANQSQANHGFLIETSSINGETDDVVIKFAQKSEHHDSKQPLLVVFTEEMKAQMEEEQEEEGEEGIVDIEESPQIPITEEDIIEEVTPDEVEVSTEPEVSHDEDAAISEDVDEVDDIVKTLMSTEGDQPVHTLPRHNDSSVTDISSVRRKYIQFLNERHRAEHGTFPNIQTFSFMSPEQHHELVSGQLTRSHVITPKRRKRRAADYGNKNHRKRKKVCSLHELYVDFDKIGWSGWIISPKGYDAFHCKGSCPFPLGQNQQPTNHATVQSIVHALGAGKDVGTPCCVPNKLFSISLLYFDDQENVILKQYDDMVATSCGCH